MAFAIKEHGGRGGAHQMIPPIGGHDPKATIGTEIGLSDTANRLVGNREPRVPDHDTRIVRLPPSTASQSVD